MAQPPVRDRILEAALALFSKKGFTPTTTREIARLADVNEVTIFRHFGSKKGLLRELLANLWEEKKPKLWSAREVQSDATYPDIMLTLASNLVDLLEESRSTFSLMLKDALAHPEVGQLAGRFPALLRQELAAFLEEQHKLGRVQTLDFELAAQGFMGMLFSSVVVARLMGVPLPFEKHEMIRGFTDIFVRGTARDLSTEEKDDGDKRNMTPGPLRGSSVRGSPVEGSMHPD